jgi:hypothetical protein
MYHTSSQLSGRAVKHNREHDGDMLREGLWIHDEGSKVVGTDYYWNDISLPRQPGAPYKIV